MLQNQFDMPLKGAYAAFERRQGTYTRAHLVVSSSRLAETHTGFTLHSRNSRSVGEMFFVVIEACEAWETTLPG